MQVADTGCRGTVRSSDAMCTQRPKLVDRNDTKCATFLGVIPGQKDEARERKGVEAVFMTNEQARKHTRHLVPLFQVQYIQ